MRSTKTAWTVTAIVIVLSAVLGCNRSLAALRSETASLITTGDAYGYCIATDCQDMVNVCRNLMTVGAKYLPEEKLGRERMERFCDQMETAGTDVMARVFAAEDIRAWTQMITAELEKTGELSERDAAYLAGFQADIKSAMARMEKDPYNDAARAFNEIEGSFPANALGFLVGPLSCFVFR